MRADPDVEDDDGLIALGAAVCVAGAGPMLQALLAAGSDVDAGRATPLKLAAEGNDYECSQLLIQDGASMAKALVDHDAVDIVENIFFISHQNTEAQPRAVDALIAARNADRLS
eukprot:1476771-Karenia_brevis.AAC.1